VDRRIRQGDIYWIENCPSPRGDNPKGRPVVIITPDPLIEAGADLLAVACSTSTYGEDPAGVPLPNSQTEPQTKSGLTSPCSAVTDWIVPVARSSCGKRVGYIWGKVLADILSKCAP
jgi:mRNA-degrading endonuclease toxin of MazEF toxin-antitoxin module